MHGGESSEFEVCANIGECAYSKHGIKRVPDCIRQDLGEGGEYLYRKTAVKGEVGYAVKPRPKLAFGVGFSGDIAVKNVGNSGEGVYYVKRRSERSNEQKHCRAYYPRDGQQIWRCKNFRCVICIFVFHQVNFQYSQ